MSGLDCGPSKFVDILPRNRWLCLLHAAPLGDALPWVWHVAIELIRIEPMHHAPRPPAEHHELFALAQTLSSWASNDQIVDLVRAHWRYRPRRPTADPITLFRNHICEQVHHPLVIGLDRSDTRSRYAWLDLYSRKSQSTVPNLTSPATGSPSRLARHSSKSALSAAARPPSPSPPHATT